MVDNKEIRVFSLLKKLRSKTDTYKDEARKSYRKVFLSFKNFIFFRYLSDRVFNESLICEWYVYLRFRGINPAKAYYYVDKLGNLYSGILKNKPEYQPRLFKDLRKKIKNTDSCEDVVPVTLKQLPSFLKSLIDEYDPQATRDLGLDLLIFSICNGAMPVEDLVSLKKGDVDLLEPVSRQIADKYIEPRRKYVFPLDQSLLTPRQSALMASSLIEGALKRYGFDSHSLSVSGNLKNPKNPDNLNHCLSILWLCLAMYHGILPSLLAAAPGNPESVRFLNLCRSPYVEDIDWKEINSRIAGSLFAGRKKWFALRLRPHVRYQDLEDRLALLDNLSVRPEFFYPCDEIARKIGRNLVWKEKPFIHDIVFFKSRPVDVYPMCHEIWDLAWCFRETRYGSYAEISEKEIENFQNTIGIFSSEFELAPAGEMPMKPGDRVVVIGGDYINKTGRILNTENQGTLDGNVIYRIQLFDTNLKWSVGLDARFLRPQ